MSHGDGGTLPSPKATSSIRYITIRVSPDALSDLATRWSAPVHIRLAEQVDGTFEMVVRNVELKHPAFACVDPNADAVPEGVVMPDDYNVQKAPPQPNGPRW